MPEITGLARLASESTTRVTAPLRVLLIEADPELGRRVKSLFEDDPGTAFTVALMPDLRSALEVLSDSAAVDVIVLGLDLPESRGIETVRVVLRAADHVPVVVLAHSGNEHLAWEATRNGATDVILHDQMKPEVQVWTLKRTVQQGLLHASLERRIYELEMTKRRFLSLVADNADAILVVDRIGIVRFVNPAAERLMRCSASELLGEMFGVPLEGVDMTEIDLCVGGTGPRTVEIHVMRTLWDGERAFISTMRDITERKKSELALRQAMQTAEQASAMKSQFLANMSHELRTPLNAIIGYSEMMMMGVNGRLQPDRYLNYVGDIHAGGKHLLSLINELLDLSKAESGQDELSEAPFDLVALAKETVHLLAGDAAMKGLSLSVSGERPSLWINADERKIKQVLLNLISNALKFTPHAGAVTVAIDHTRWEEPRIVVKDTGVGIPKDQISRAFAAFMQIENAYTRVESRGTGLGLALTKRFVELHKGRISLESEENVGTTVSVVLPQERSINTKSGIREVISIAHCAPCQAKEA